MTVLSDQTFRLEGDAALEHARRALMDLADQKGFELELQNGVLQLEFEEPSPTKFVVSPNAPTRQVWVAAMTRSYKLAWSSEANTFALNGETLVQLLERLVHTLLDTAA